MSTKQFVEQINIIVDERDPDSKKHLISELLENINNNTDIRPTETTN